MTTFGLQVPWFSWQGSPGNHREVLRDVAAAAEETGFSSLWVMDHLFQIPHVGAAEQEMHEAYTALGYLAGVTERIKLGALVTGVTYRHPAILVKEVTTLDVLSGGRAWFGIGAAWFEREHLGLGVPFPPVSERFERLEEALQIALQMWSDDDGPFKGTHYSLEETLCSPQPLQRPRPPIMVGGGGEKKTLRLVAKYADACNIFGSANDIRHKRDVIRRHCEHVERPFEEIQITRLSTAFSAEQVEEEIPDLIEAGVDHLIYNVPAVHSLDPITGFAGVIEKYSE